MTVDEVIHITSFLFSCVPLTHARTCVQLWGESGPGSHRRKDERRTVDGSGPSASEAVLQAIEFAQNGDLDRARGILAAHIQLTHLTLEMLLPALQDAFP